MRPVLLGVDLRLLRLLAETAPRAPRVLDPRLTDAGAADELYEEWSADVDLTLLVAAEPALDPWMGVKGSRPVDAAAMRDAPLVLVIDARERGATAAAAAAGVQRLCDRPELEIAGVIVVGGDERGPAGELRHLLEGEAGLPVLGWLSPWLSGEFARRYAGDPAGPRQIGASPPADAASVCREAAAQLDLGAIRAAAARRGFLVAPPRRLLSPSPAAGGTTLAIAWGSPLRPFALEVVDLFRAMGVTLAPVELGCDPRLPEVAEGLVIAGLLDEDELAAFAANESLRAAIARAVVDDLPTLALGGGALLLLRAITDTRGDRHAMTGVLPAEAEGVGLRRRPRYATAVAAAENPFAAGETTVCELFAVNLVHEREAGAAWRLAAPGAAGYGGEARVEGFAAANLLATTLVPSLAMLSEIAARFVAAARSLPPDA